jgi:radical SAM superfamily enzyme YgiQ (UPF0313 family)
MAGFISGFDHDTPQSIEAMADRLLDIGVDVPFLSILTPFKGTPLYDQLAGHDRLLGERGWEYYNGYNVAFTPHAMSPEASLASHRRLWKRAFSPWHSLRRIWNSVRHLRRGALLMSLFMNVFYCSKRLRGNFPLDAASLRTAAPAEAAHRAPATVPVAQSQ